MQTGGGNWVSKAGADGVQAIGVAREGFGIAIRIADGSPRALHAATVHAMQRYRGVLGNVRRALEEGKVIYERPKG